MTLIPVDAGVCPACGGALRREMLDQPTLFIACGFGATLRTVIRFCRCGWAVEAERTEIRPPKS